MKGEMGKIVVPRASGSTLREAQSIPVRIVNVELPGPPRLIGWTKMDRTFAPRRDVTTPQELFPQRINVLGHHDNRLSELAIAGAG